MKPNNYPVTPEYLWNIFYDFTQTPRPSRNEVKIREYIINLANKANLKYIEDKAQNIIIYVPGRNGREDDDTVIIQNHVDMVTDALKGKLINFNTDPIQTLVDGDWLTADGTTLGADNGIGCAAALAVIFDDSIIHPPLELLFTMDEETGLNGALGLEDKYLSGRKMLNLDTEEWGSLYIGCAGGIDYEFNRDYELETVSDENILLKIQVEGFVGGHSGLDIHEQRGNAIKFLAESLLEIQSETSFTICEFRGGKAHNIIPRDAFVTLAVKAQEIDKIDVIIAGIEDSWKTFMPENDRTFSVEFSQEKVLANTLGLSRLNSSELINFLILFPHGAHSYDLGAREIVSMSNNLAKVLLVGGKFFTQSSLRFFDRDEVRIIEKQIQILAKTYGIKCESHSEYPSWKPVRENPVLETVKECYSELFGEKAVVTAIHAGLECGILRDKIGPLDVVSFGPTITGAHSPDERIFIPSVETFWELFKSVLAKI
jgi:dipeptidase D